MKNFFKKVFGESKPYTMPPHQQATKTIDFSIRSQKSTPSQTPSKVLSFPIPEPKKEQPVLQRPLRTGENYVLHFEGQIEIESGVISAVICYVTNYRFEILDEEGRLTSRQNCFPLGFIHKISISQSEMAGIVLYDLEVKTKYSRTISVLVGKEYYSKIIKLEQLIYPTKIIDTFAFKHSKQYKERISPFCPKAEFERQMLPEELAFFDNKKGDIICQTYGDPLVLPRSLGIDEVRGCSSFRSKQRLPALSYYWKEGRRAVFRSSQNLVGIMGKRNELDQKMLREIGKIGRAEGSNAVTCHIYDARPKINAVGMKMAGKGFQNEQNYANCQIFFLNIDNIHVVRDAFNRINQATQKQEEYFKAVADSNWLKLISIIMAGAKRMVDSLEQGFNVLVHCSDGWDRTSQLCAIVQIVLDPYFRTLEGLQVLIQKDWNYFGHMFATRNGTRRGEKDDQKAPIFTQFLDCVYQLHQCYPFAFEFNRRLLVYLDYHSRSNKFGDFLFNCDLERQEAGAQDLSSIWETIRQGREQFTNPYYRATEQVLGLQVFESGYQIRLFEQLFLREEEGLSDTYQIFSNEGTKFMAENLEKKQAEMNQKIRLIQKNIQK